MLAARYGAPVQGSVALGPRGGHFVSRVRSDSPPAPAGAPTRCARLDGYSVHADVRIPAHDRQRLEHLCRYIARPPLALDRRHELPDERLLYQLRRPWSDGTTSILFAPMDSVGRAIFHSLSADAQQPRGPLDVGPGPRPARPLDISATPAEHRGSGGATRGERGEGWRQARARAPSKFLSPADVGRPAGHAG